jgi:DNA ligase (NAD+)
MWKDMPANFWMDQSRKFLQDEENISLEFIEDLRNAIRFHEWRYYVLHNPLLSDKEYDLLFYKLKKIEDAHPEMITPDSPTQRVSSDLTEEFPKVKHMGTLLSLDNSYNADDLRDFDRQVRKLAKLSNSDLVEYHVEPKLDGISLAVVYENNLFKRGATRGNGLEGEDISNNVKTINSLPLKAAFDQYGIDRIELRGEAFMYISDFNKTNEIRQKKGEDVFANPRNSTAGSLRMKDPSITAERNIALIVYEVNNSEPIELPGQTQEEALDLLKNLGFKTPKDLTILCKGIDEVIDFAEKAESERASLPYEIDGLVIKVNDFNIQKKLGYTSHHPRWAMAFKFKAKQAHTTLERVEYQVGKTGAITPVAKITPTELAGVRISSISLHNQDFIQSKDLKIGDTVVIERAGDVIPYIVKSLPELRNGTEEKIVFPDYCPFFQESKIRLERAKDEAVWRCPTCLCGKQDVQKMIHFVSKSAMNIEGLGPSIIYRFHDLGWLQSIVDIYRLDYDKVQALEGFGVQSANNLKASIDSSKRRPLKQFLSGLAIHHLGKRASTLIAEQINHVRDLYNWNEDKYIEIREIGPVLAKNMVDFFTKIENQQTLEKLIELGVDLRAKADDRAIVVDQGSIFAGKTILFTGTLEKMSRKEAQQKAVEKGAKNISAVSNNLDILVVGTKAGSKLKKAQALGTIEIIDEQEFINRIGE